MKIDFIKLTFDENSKNHKYLKASHCQYQTTGGLEKNQVIIVAPPPPCA